jgi:tRNA 2-selenouridine synthase
LVCVCVKEIDVKEFIKDINNFVIIDVRTKEEFEEAHIPKAINLPLFTKKEKDLISKIYYKEGEKKARIYALKFIAPKIYRIIKEIEFLKKNNEDKRIIIYCWRGGMRSFSITILANLLGFRILKLKGGFRAFRKYTLQRIEELVKNKRFIVICGFAGTGKTRILKKLKESNFPVIDLEDLAQHRGSIFGNIGLKERKQKMFDILLWQELERLKYERFIIVEGESKKIGNLEIPKAFWEKMQEGLNIYLELPLKERVEIIKKDYLNENIDKKELLKIIKKLEKRIDKKVFENLLRAIENKKWEKLIELLLINYYDKLYLKSFPKYFIKEIKAQNFEELFIKTKEELKKLIYSKSFK